MKLEELYPNRTMLWYIMGACLGWINGFCIAQLL